MTKSRLKRYARQFAKHKHRRLLISVLVLVVVGVGMLSFVLHESNGSASPEVKFTDASKSGLAIVPASGASFPYCYYSLGTSGDGGGFNLLANISNYYVSAAGLTFCVSNSSGNEYFIPARTTAELQSFINAVSQLSGVSEQTL